MTERNSCPTCGCVTYNETGRCESALQLIKAKARIAELEKELTHAKRWNGIIGAAHHVICRANDGHHDKIKALKAQIKAAVDWCENESVCIGDGGQTNFNWNFVKSKDILKILTSETGKGGK